MSPLNLTPGEMIAGLEYGIATMKKAEEAQFLISPQYAFGKRGVPPRIPGDATSKPMIITL